jgi:uncharacterized membrane protein YecN with MAPEG domain
MEETEPDYVKVELDSSKGECRGTSIMITITPSYAAILGLLFFVLSVRTLRLRRKLQIAIGDAGNPQLLRAMRVHANFAEYAAFTLLLAFMLEFQGAHDLLVHALCLCLLIGRIAHAYGVSNDAEDYRYRVFGMSMTFTALVGSAASLLVLQVGDLIS